MFEYRWRRSTIPGIVSEGASDALNWAVLAAVLLVPLSFLYGLLRPRFGATTRRPGMCMK